MTSMEIGKKTRRTAVNTEQLIALVEENRTLYDKRCRQYRDLDIVKNIWTSISNTLGVSVSEAKIRWRSLKDGYIRKRREYKESKKSVSGRDDVKEPKWPWFKSLGFLDEYLEDDCTASNMPLDDAAGDNNEDEDEDDTILNDSESAEADLKGHTSDHVSPSTSRRISPVPPPKKRAKMTDESGKLLGILEDTRNRNQVRQEIRDKVLTEALASMNKERDSDEQFMLSYAHELKQMSDATKSLVKLKVAQVFHDARFGTRAEETDYVPQGNLYQPNATMWSFQ